MGRPVRKGDEYAHIVDPSWHYCPDEVDCWHIYLAAGNITARDVFAAYSHNDQVAVRVIDQCTEYWGMAVANLVSIFNPEKIIFGGGVFGPAIQLLDRISEEARKWAQPISIQEVKLEASALKGDAGLTGAGFLALRNEIML